ncbi:dihydroxyacetone kinase subunit DhaL [Promicromonospora vindobonensis]|uniref:Dihydroxyacetone kinase subunit DhaL n=1 Tax=Promicromonospora vindobonensis TaxID=195748 RepID=A0ABW5VR54_9MICO
MATAVTNEVIIDWLARFHDIVAKQRAYLTELDSAIGDADHGVNMDRGLAQVVETLTQQDAGSDASTGALLQHIGNDLLTSLGGAAGPLYSALFLGAGAVAGERTRLDPGELADSLRAGLAELVRRGSAESGDKTMFDALDPAVEALRQAADDGAGLGQATASAAAAAVAGREATAPMLARKGRASYLGERSIGHVDPGAASATMLVIALVEAVAQE